MWGEKSKMNSKKKLHCSMRKRKENEQCEEKEENWTVRTGLHCNVRKRKENEQ